MLHNSTKPQVKSYAGMPMEPLEAYAHDTTTVYYTYVIGCLLCHEFVFGEVGLRHVVVLPSSTQTRSVEADAPGLGHAGQP